MFEQFIDGKLAAHGPYTELLEQSENFSKFIEACQNKNEREQQLKKESERNDLKQSDNNSSLSSNFFVNLMNIILYFIEYFEI